MAEEYTVAVRYVCNDPNGGSWRTSATFSLLAHDQAEAREFGIRIMKSIPLVGRIDDVEVYEPGDEPEQNTHGAQ